MNRQQILCKMNPSMGQMTWQADNAPLAPQVGVAWCDARLPTWWNPDTGSVARTPAVLLPRWAVPTCPLSDAAWQGSERCWHPRRHPSQAAPTQTRHKAAPSLITYSQNTIQGWVFFHEINIVSTNKSGASDLFVLFPFLFLCWSATNDCVLGLLHYGKIIIMIILVNIEIMTIQTPLRVSTARLSSGIISICCIIPVFPFTFRPTYTRIA